MLFIGTILTATADSRLLDDDAFSDPFFDDSCCCQEKSSQ